MTQPTKTPGPPPALPQRPPRRRSVWNVVGVLAVGLLAVVVVGANFVRVPYVIISPGEATPLDDTVVSVSGTDTYAHDGQFLFLTVRVSNRDPSVWRWLFAKLDDDVEITKREEVIGCASFEQNAALQNLLMRESQDVAKTVALERLGYEVEEASSQVVIVDVLCDGPSEGHISPGDVVTAIDGSPVVDVEDVRPLVQAHRPGEMISVTVLREEEEVTVRVKLGREPASLVTTTTGDGPPPERGAFLGVRSQLVTHEQYPFEIAIDTQRVSGPSAGLAFTLAIIDDLTRGELTGGQRVAVTGSIVPGGGVAPVGGVAQKAVAARRNGAMLMIVPACAPPEPRDCEAAEARAKAGEMRVVIVEDIDDALEALARLGGDPIPPRPSTASAT